MAECSKLVSSTCLKCRSLGILPRALQYSSTRLLSFKNYQTWSLGCSLHFLRRLSSDVKLTTDQTQTNSEEILALAKIVEESSRKTVSNTETILPQLQHISQIVVGASKKVDSMIREAQQMKDQSAAVVQQTSISRVNHIDQVNEQTLSNTRLILQHLEQVCSGFSQGRTDERVGHAGAEETIGGLHQPPLKFENTVQSLVSNEITRTMKFSAHETGRLAIS